MMDTNLNSDIYHLKCNHLMSDLDKEIFKFEDSFSSKSEILVLEMKRLRESYMYSKLKTADLIGMRRMIDRELIDRGIKLCEI